MEDYNENIPDENIQINTPKKCIFLINKMNMFIKSDKKRNNYEEYIKNKLNEKNKDDSSNDSDNLKTIIKEPSILTSNILIDLKKLIKTKNNSREKKRENCFNKIKRNIKIYLSNKKIIHIENFKNENNILNNYNDLNSNLNIKLKSIKVPKKNKSKINIKNNTEKNSRNNSLKKKIIRNNNIKRICYSSRQSNKKQNFIKKKEIKNKKINNNKIFIKKLNKEFKNKATRNSLSINKKDKRKNNEKEMKRQGIIKKKITIKPELLAENKNIFYKEQKELISSLSENNIIVNNKDIYYKIKYAKSIPFSKSIKNVLKGNKYKSKIYHIDYSHNKKRDLTNIIIGINLIKKYAINH